MIWNDDPQSLRASKRRETGVPYVDAGMRQLLAEGWMHNRVRMAVPEQRQLAVVGLRRRRWVPELERLGEKFEEIGQRARLAPHFGDAADCLAESLTQHRPPVHRIVQRSANPIGISPRRNTPHRAPEVHIVSEDSVSTADHVF